jgi:hypothetical protein
MLDQEKKKSLSCESKGVPTERTMTGQQITNTSGTFLEEGMQR